MTLKEDIQPYFEQKYQFIGLTPNPLDHSTDNGLLFSATYLMLNPRDHEYISNYVKILNECQDKDYQGLYARYPGDKGFNAHDDQVGICFFDYIFSAQQCHANNIYLHGKKTWGFWNTENPEKRTGEAFFVRIPSHWAMIKAASEVKLNLFDVLYSSLAYIGDMFVKKEETNGRCLLLLRSFIFKERSVILDFVMSLWRKKMNKLYPDGIKGLYSIYFGPEHPFSKYAPEKF